VAPLLREGTRDSPRAELDVEDAACYRARYLDAIAYQHLHEIEGARASTPRSRRTRPS
jgi:hypothetical protein